MDPHTAGEDVGEDRAALGRERVGHAEPEGSGGQLEQPSGARNDHHARPRIRAGGDDDAPARAPNRHADTRVDRPQDRRLVPEQPAAPRVALEVRREEVSDDRHQTHRVVAPERNAHGSRSTFVASRRSNNA